MVQASNTVKSSTKHSSVNLQCVSGLHFMGEETGTSMNCCVPIQKTGLTMRTWHSFISCLYIYLSFLILFDPTIYLLFPELQGNLADYNLLVDLINTDVERAEVDLETKEMHEANQQEAEQLDAVFTLKQDLEITMRQLENEIEEVQHRQRCKAFVIVLNSITLGL